MADTVRLQLLRKGALLLDVLPLAVAEGPVDIGGAARLNGDDFIKIDARLVAGVFEHGQGLAAPEQHHVGSLQLVP